MIFCAIWYHLYNLKSVENTHGGVLVTLHACFSRSLNCTNGTKSRNASHIFFECHKSHYQDSISNGIDIANFLFFSYNFFLKKKQNIRIQYTLIFFLLFNYSASISLSYNYSFLYNFLFIHSEVSIGILDKRMFEFLEAPVHERFEKKVILKFFGNFPVKHPCQSSF